MENLIEAVREERDARFVGGGKVGKVAGLRCVGTRGKHRQQPEERKN